MTYNGVTSGSNYSGFFVVGGNSAGTETGRVYAYLRYSQKDYLFDSSHNATKLTSFSMSTWQSDTMIVYTDAYTQTVDPSDYGFTTTAAMVTAGVSGQTLFDGVELP